MDILQNDARSLPPPLGRLLERRFSYGRSDCGPDYPYGWAPVESTFAQFVADCRTPRHPTGSWFCAAAPSDGRCDPNGAMSFCDIVAVEVSYGYSLEEIMEPLREMRVEALVQATADHFRSTTIVPKAAFEVFTGHDHVSLEDVTRYLQERLSYVSETKAEDVSHIDHHGIASLLVKHRPTEAFRILFPLAERFHFRPWEERLQQMERWVEMMQDLQGELSLIIEPWDLSPSRPLRMLAPEVVGWTGGGLLSVAE